MARKGGKEMLVLPYSWANGTYEAQLKPILNEWVEIIKEYSRLSSGHDALYYGNERSSVSTFAGAVWSAGYFAHEATPSWKHDDNRRYFGRIDLWFWKKRARYNYFVEAKQKMPILTDNINVKRQTEYLNKWLSISVDAAENNVKEWGMQDARHCGLLFLVPRIKKEQFKKANVRNILNRFNESVDRTESDFYSYVYPDFIIDEEEKLGYVGACVIGKFFTVKIILFNSILIFSIQTHRQS